MITRINLSQSTVNQLAELNRYMNEANESLFVAVSIPATFSYALTENPDVIASPQERIDCLIRLHNAGIPSILLARPIFPNSIIPSREITELIIENHDSIDAVVASGLAVNEDILSRLNIPIERFSFLPGNNNEYLIGSSAKNIRYIDVNDELSEINSVCKKFGIVFSTHSMDALNQL